MQQRDNNKTKHFFHISHFCFYAIIITQVTYNQIIFSKNALGTYAEAMVSSPSMMMATLCCP